jgi:hypothetical protein
MVLDHAHLVCPIGWGNRGYRRVMIGAQSNTIHDPAFQALAFVSSLVERVALWIAELWRRVACRLAGSTALAAAGGNRRRDDGIDAGYIWFSCGHNGRVAQRGALDDRYRVDDVCAP